MLLLFVSASNCLLSGGRDGLPARHFRDGTPAPFWPKVREVPSRADGRKSYQEEQFCLGLSGELDSERIEHAGRILAARAIHCPSSARDPAHAHAIPCRTLPEHLVAALSSASVPSKPAMASLGEPPWG